MQVNSSISCDNDNGTIKHTVLRNGIMNELTILNNIRLRLREQLCDLDVKAQSHSYFVKELRSFFRNRGLVESKHARGLETILNCFKYGQLKSSNSFQTKYSCWNLLIKETYSLSIDHKLLSEIYNAEMMLNIERNRQIYNKFYEFIFETHVEVLRILRKLYAKTTTHTLNQKNQSSSNDILEILKSGNIIKNFTETSNADIYKRMLKDLKDIIYSMDLGFCLMISQAILTHVTPEHKRFQMKLNCRKAKNASPFDTDFAFRKKIIEKNEGTVLSKKNSKYIRQFNEEKNDDFIENLLQFECLLQTQLLSLKERKLRKNIEVNYGILETLGTVTGNIVEPEKRNFREDRASGAVISKTSLVKSLSNSSLSNIINQIALKTNMNTSQVDNKAKFILMDSRTRPKLFGGSLEEYLKITNEQIPLIIRSCIRVISSYGLRSQGIFRVSGSQIEIMNFRESFENGEDPLAEATETADMNSVAGVLKLYLRELQEPLFPSKYFNFFIYVNQMQMDSEYEAIGQIRNFFNTISKPVVVVIRFLFSFLSHLSEYSGENLMDAFNLAISFGPTLMPTPEDKKNVQHQTQLNELIKFIIINHQAVFPMDLEGPQYHKQKFNKFELKGDNILSISTKNKNEILDHF
ncbi:SLIT-ROBO Rho GTPase-activating protein 1-like isoform X2 [Episyrphus balteatus]|uniref:SLIT-ROBO Rho GTPase-activating protein 1-like isoform X2 n=1 Tax=Episyrphus balteatus TaxID=286459 RepID=UPI002485F539|nr:SLIT-ROBO Rho GTPase-activating protein 1-like isoform X2 [Episyrphus balteatus]